MTPDVIMFQVVRAATLAMSVASVLVHIAMKKTWGQLLASIMWSLFGAYYLFGYCCPTSNFLIVSMLFSFSGLFLLRAAGLTLRERPRRLYGSLFGRKFVDRMDLAESRTEGMINRIFRKFRIPK